MTVPAELLELLVCPKSQSDLAQVELPEVVCRQLVEKFREHFTDEEPAVSVGLLCRDCALVFPVVSDIPILLLEDALPATVLER